MGAASGCRGWWAARGGWVSVGWPGPCGSRWRSSAADKPRKQTLPVKTLLSWSAAAGRQSRSSLLYALTAPLPHLRRLMLNPRTATGEEAASPVSPAASRDPAWR
jgi:hypothetical protein